MEKIDKIVRNVLTDWSERGKNASNGDEPQNVKVEKCRDQAVEEVGDGPPVPSLRLLRLDKAGELLRELSRLVDDLGRSPFATARPINALMSRLYAQLGVVSAIVEVFAEEERANGPS